MKRYGNPWSVAVGEFPEEGSLDEKIDFLMNFAVRAPSTHNTQPWLFERDGHVIRIFADESRTLPYGDPRGHYQLISIGALIESARVAAEGLGVHVVVEYAAPDEEHCAVLRFGEEAAYITDERRRLFGALEKRFNPRGIFTEEEVEPTAIEAMRQIIEDVTPEVLVTPVTDDGIRAHVAEKTGRGVRIAHADPRFRREMSRWMKNSLFPGRDGIPGYTLGMSFLLSFIIPTLIRFVDMSKVLAKKSRDAVATAPVVVLCGSRGSSRTDILAVGRAAQRAMLTAHVHGYTTSIFVGAIESGELDIARATHDASIEFIFVAGKLKEPIKDWRYSPRHAVSKKMLS